MAIAPLPQPQGQPKNQEQAIWEPVEQRNGVDSAVPVLIGANPIAPAITEVVIKVFAELFCELGG